MVNKCSLQMIMLTLRKGLKEHLVRHLESVECGEAENTDQVLVQVRKHPWDLLILDITMPGRSALDILADLKLLRPELPVLILSMLPEDQFAKRVLKGGAWGYLKKESAPEELIQAVRRILAGGGYMVTGPRREICARPTGKCGSASPRSVITERIRRSRDDRLRENSGTDRRRAPFERNDRQHLSCAHPGKDEDDHDRGADTLRRSQPSCRLTTPAQLGIPRVSVTKAQQLNRQAVVRTLQRNRSATIPRSCPDRRNNWVCLPFPWVTRDPKQAPSADEGVFRDFDIWGQVDGYQKR